jgi:hypothetical protein
LHLIFRAINGYVVSEYFHADLSIHFKE